MTVNRQGNNDRKNLILNKWGLWVAIATLILTGIGVFCYSGVSKNDEIKQESDGANSVVKTTSNDSSNQVVHVTTIGKAEHVYVGGKENKDEKISKGNTSAANDSYTNNKPESETKNNKSGRSGEASKVNVINESISEPEKFDNSLIGKNNSDPLSLAFENSYLEELLHGENSSIVQKYLDNLATENREVFISYTQHKIEKKMEELQDYITDIQGKLTRQQLEAKCKVFGTLKAGIVKLYDDKIKNGKGIINIRENRNMRNNIKKLNIDGLCISE